MNLAGIKIPVVLARLILDNAGLNEVGADGAGDDRVGHQTVTVAERAEIPRAIGIFAVGDAEVTAADLDAHGRIGLFRLVVDEQALTGLDVGVTAGLVHHLVKAID